MNSAAAFTKMPDGSCCAVKVEQTPAGIKLLFKHTGPSEELNEALAAAGISPSKTHTVMGVDPKGIAFYNIEIPQVPDAQLDAVVRMQAETILPLPLEQMQIAYTKGKVIADKCRITIAAGRTAQLVGEMAFAKNCSAAGIVLTSQGIVKAFNTLFEIDRQKYVILNIRKSDTQVLLCEDGKLAHAAKLDIGAEDLNNADQKCGEMFIYDLRNTLEMFGLDIAAETAVFVFSGSHSLTETIADGLNDVNILARCAELDRHAITGQTDSDEEDISPYLEAVGCALLTLDNENRPLDLFSELYNADKKKKKKKTSPAVPLIRAAIIFGLMLVATFFTFNYINKLELEKYQNNDIDKLVAQQKIRELIAKERPDVLKLLTLINEDPPAKMKIDSITFKKGEKVTIASQASSHEEMIAIAKFLSSKKEFTELVRQNPSFDEKNKKYSFKINFYFDRGRKIIR